MIFTEGRRRRREDTTIRVEGGSGSSDAAGTLLEREDEVAELGRAVDALTTGTGRVVVLAGPAGAGKTRLLAEAARQADRAGAVVLRAVGEDRAVALPPYELARMLLGPSLGEASPQRRAALLAGPARHAAVVVDDEPGDSGTASAAGAVVHGLYWYLVALADDAPVMLLVDDLHWADAASRSWLLYLADRLEDIPVLLVVAVRTGFEGDPLLAALGRAPGCRVLDLAPLSAEAVSALATARFGAAPSPSLVAACLDVTAGNPLLIVDLLARLAARDGVAELRTQAANVFGDRVGAALDHQPAAALALANAVAVLGEDADAVTCGLVAGLDPAERDRRAEDLVTAGILDTRAWRCRHPLVRGAVLGRLPQAEREPYYAAAARVLDSLARPVDRVASMLLAAGVPRDPGIVEILAGAGSRALDRGDPAAAEQFLRHALEGPLSVEVRVRVLTDLSVAERPSSPGNAREHLEEALALIESPRERAATVINLVPLLSGSDAAELVSVLGHTLDELDCPDDAETVELAHRLRALFLYCSSEHRAHVHRLWRWFGEVDPSTLGSGVGESAQLGLHTYFAAAALRGDASTTADLARRSVHGEMAGHELFQPIFMGALAVLEWAEQDDELSTHYDAVLGLARRRYWPMIYSFVCGVRSASRFRNGRVAEALADARTALELRRPALNDEVRMMLVPVTTAPLVEMGQLNEADELLWSDFPGSCVESWQWSWVLEGRSRALAARGRTRAALDELLACGEHLRRFGVTNPAALPWQGAAARLHQSLGETVAARDAAEEHLELARRWGTHGHVGAALRDLGVVVGGRAGHALLEEGVASLERSPKALELTRALVDLGCSHREEGRLDDARSVLRRALGHAESSSSFRLADQSRRELIAAGGRPRRHRQSGPAALTPAELEVARFAAEGRSNRDIAQALFVTQRTVELHLTHCYRKLRIDGREDLAASLGA